MSTGTGALADGVPQPSASRRELPGPGALSRVVAVLLRVFVRPVITLFARFPDARWPFALADRAAWLLPRPYGVRRHAISLPHCRAELLIPARPTAGRAILYLHGGGFIVCGLNTHRRLTADIARAAGCPALAVDYRQMPRHGLGEALDDAVAGFRALLDEGYSSSEIRIVGDSAGGYLAVATALAVVRRGLGRPGGLVLMSPMTGIDPDLALEPADDPLLTAPVVSVLSRKLAAKPAISADLLPHRRLAADDLSPLPPTLIQVGTREVLRAGAEELADAIAAAGGRCELQVWAGQFHVFQAGAVILAPARKAIAEIGSFLVDPR
ncbi:alpha/beta hydrolase [Mycolicibacillus trivialis]|uniref:alpha/beta hydrolase n=1 Tax=Mycolicibacillus trivialis TaxID=1798 RepID=UPI000A14F021|nr:alpha/beta hydrolase [Mycolicibacillus trivialis]